MNQLSEDDEYNPADWEKFSVFYTTYFTYTWGISSCEVFINSKAGKELREMIKNVEFDVIVQDVTLDQCLYSLWEVGKQFLNKCCLYLYFQFIFMRYYLIN